MSEASDNATPAPAESTPAAPREKNKPRRSWGRRLIRIGLVLLLFAFVFRLSLPFLLPWTINRVAGVYGMTCRYEKMDLNLLGGDVGLWHVVIAPKTGGEPLLRTEYCRGAISLLPLLHGKLHVRQAVADGAELNIQREPNGRIPALEGLLAGHKPSSKPPTLDLTPPLTIDALRLEHASAHVRDRSITPEVDTTLLADIGLSDLGSMVRPARFWVETSSQPMLDILRIDGTATGEGKTSDANLRVFVRGLHPRTVGGYLSAMGIRASGENLSMGCNVHITTSPSAADPNGILANAQIKDVIVLADGQEALGVDRIVLNTDTITPADLRLGKVSVEGVRLRTSRDRDGLFGAAGLEYAGASKNANPTAMRAADDPPPVRQATPLAWSVSQLDVKDVRVWFKDDTINPEPVLSLQVPELSVKQVSSEPGQASTPSQIKVALTAPGVVRSVEISATALPFARQKSATATVRAEGIRPEALQPYLRALGIRSELKDATLICNAEGGLSVAENGAITADADLHDIRISDGIELLALKQIKIARASAAPDLKAFRVGDLEVDGPALSASRSADGVVRALGFQLISREPKAPVRSGPPQATAAVPARAFSLPRVDIDHVGWKGVKLELADQAVSPTESFALSDAGVELDDLHINPAGPTTRPARPGRFRAWLAAPGVAGNLVATGTLTPTQSGVSLDMQVNGSHIDARMATPYLTALGIEPTLNDGSLQFHAGLDLSQQNDRLTCSLKMSDARLAEGQKELLAVDAARIDGIDIRPGRIDVNAIDVTKPRATVVRDASGALLLAGVRIRPAPTKESDPALARTGPSTRPSVPETNLALALHKLNVQDASVNWTDQSVRPTAQTTGTLSAQLTDFAFGPEPKPAAFKVTASAEGILGALTATGTLAVSPRSAAVRADVSATGVREGALAGYLPPGSHVSVKDGRLNVSMDAAVAIDGAGAASGHLKVDHFTWRDGAQGPNLLAFDSALVSARKVDLPGSVCALDEVSLSGLDTSVVATTDGQTHLLGLTIGGPTPQPTRPPPAQCAPPAAPTTQPAIDAAALAAARRKPLPLVTLQKLAINLRSARAVDESRPGAAPLVLSNVNVTNEKPIELLGNDPGSRPPVVLQITGGIAPVVGAFQANVEASPFAPRLTARVDVSAEHIRGEGVTELFPELKPQIDGHKLRDGRFKAHVEAQANIARHGPAQFDFTHPFDIDLLVRSIEFRNGADGPLLAGLDEIRSDDIHVDPGKKLVTVRALELTKPAAMTFRDAQGLHAMGLVMKIPTASPQPAAANEQRSPAVAAAQPAPADAPEVRVSKLTVSGIDFRYEDRTVNPPALVPLNGLDVDVRNLSSLLMKAERPVKFSVLVNAGKVPVPAHSTTTALTGAVRDLRTLQAGGHIGAAPRIENRDLFSEITLDGQLVMFPKPRGYVKSSVSGLELTGFRGIAKSEGINVQDGTFDSSSQVRLPGDGSMDTRSKLSLTDLSVTEPPNGPIYRYLHLPAPLDVALAAVRDQDGALAFPIDVPVKQGHLSGGDIAVAAAGAVGTVFARAVAAAPVKAAGAVGETVTDVVGAIVPLGGAGRKKPSAEQPTVIAFAPGATVPDSRESTELARVLDRLKKDPKLDVTLRHDLSREDLRRAWVRANPSPRQCLALADQLRERRAELLARRAELAGKARAALAASTPAQAQAGVEQLRAVDREIASSDDALDHLYEMLRPGAERQADRRARQACLEIARDRLDAVRDALASAGINPDQRVRVAKPQFSVTAGPSGAVVISIVKKKS